MSAWVVIMALLLAAAGCDQDGTVGRRQAPVATAASSAQGSPRDMEEMQMDTAAAAAAVALIRRDGNHLSGEQSLYLRQHARNPVDWYPWGREALGRARAEGKLIFLSVGYSSCHWCHVMEGEVFENDIIAAYLNEHFVCIKVDREERPDIDSVYMTAVQLMSGRGGWPLNVFLTPEQEPFFGGTYFPADRFLSLITQIARTYAADPGQFREVAEELAHTLALDVTPAGGARGELAGVPGRVMENAWRWYDDERGGFGGAQKFPVPTRWEFVLHYYRQTGDPEILLRLTTTLDAMAAGGIYDHIGGGFHRYSVDPEWTVPHFEKMLYDNAQLANLYLEAAAVTGNERYAEIGRDTLDFLMREMRDPRGGFYASFDADSGGEEGTYYVWTPAELAEVAGEKDGAVLARLLGVTEAGNFEGASVLTRRVDSAELAGPDRGRDETSTLFAAWRRALADKRAGRVPPGLDRKIVTAWTSMTVKALVAAYCFFDDPSYLEAGEAAAGFLWENHRREDGSLYRASNGGVATSPAILDDYAQMAGAELALFQATGGVQHLDRARSIAEFVLAEFRHPDAGFYLTPRSTMAPLSRQVEIHDSVEPSGNAAMLRVLHDLSVLTGDPVYSACLDQTLGRYLALMESSGLDMAAWHDLAVLRTNPRLTVVITGDGNAAAELLSAARASLAPYTLIVPLSGKAALPGVPATAGKIPPEGGAVAFVCEHGSCRSPTADPAELAAQMKSGWRH